MSNQYQILYKTTVSDIAPRPLKINLQCKSVKICVTDIYKPKVCWHIIRFRLQTVHKNIKKIIGSLSRSSCLTRVESKLPPKRSRSIIFEKILTSSGHWGKKVLWLSKDDLNCYETITKKPFISDILLKICMCPI